MYALYHASMLKELDDNDNNPFLKQVSPIPLR